MVVNEKKYEEWAAKLNECYIDDNTGNFLEILLEAIVDNGIDSVTIHHKKYHVWAERVDE